MSTTVVFGLVIAFVGVCGLWQGTSGAAVLLESTDRWPIAGSFHRQVIPVDDQFVVRDVTGIDNRLFGYSEFIDEEAAEEARRQPVSGGWFPRGKRSIREGQMTPEEAIVLIIGGKRRYGNWLSAEVEPIRRAIPPPGFSAPRGKKAMDLESHQ